MGNLDRPGGQPDVPEEAGPAKVPQAKESGIWLNLDRQTDEQLRSALGLDRVDRNDPADIDYLAHDPRVGSDRTVIVGKSDSPDNPKRLAIPTDDGRLVDVEGPVPDDPSGEELLEL